MAVKVMFSLPNQLVSQMKTFIPPRERSKIIAAFLKKEISVRERSLYLSAKKLEESAGLKKEMEIWDKNFGEDGLKDV
ncbi:MAG: hypothetical protein K0S63_1235 [Gammaproteobacteria bacterium]|jgi:hypothetical protein|nr:hypothetical protein [Gammaproteobacteria bacterium]